jgi:hypothetical protein
MSKAVELARKYCEGSSFEDACMEKPAYIAGYHQAEKDLLENKHETSWRLDKKLWKGIKDIEEASYQYMYDASNDWAYDIPTWKDVQDAFKAGSEWKEDLELTWEDIKTIDKLLNKCVDYSNPYQEVLKRFKEMKK